MPIASSGTILKDRLINLQKASGTISFTSRCLWPSEGYCVWLRSKVDEQVLVSLAGKDGVKAQDEHLWPQIDVHPKVNHPILSLKQWCSGPTRLGEPSRCG